MFKNCLLIALNSTVWLMLFNMGISLKNRTKHAVMWLQNVQFLQKEFSKMVYAKTHIGISCGDDLFYVVEL